MIRITDLAPRYSPRDLALPTLMLFRKLLAHSQAGGSGSGCLLAKQPESFGIN